MRAASVRRLLALAASALALLGAHASIWRDELENDPASCGSACSRPELATFPFWQRMMAGAGVAEGPLYDGTYFYLGTVDGKGWVLSSNHSGSSATTTSYRFLAGPYAGQRFRADSFETEMHDAGSCLGFGTSKLGWDGTSGGYKPSYPACTPRIYRVAPMQYAPGCVGDANPVACCSSYQMGNGACSGSPACDGGGCVTSPLPPLDLPPMATIAELQDEANDSATIVNVGLGGHQSDTLEWYLECTNDDTRGGLPSESKHACCTGTEFSGSTPTAITNVSIGNFFSGYTADTLAIGGFGHDCDSLAGYTYLGPVFEAADGKMVWVATDLDGDYARRVKVNGDSLFTGAESVTWSERSDSFFQTSPCVARYSSTPTTVAEALARIQPPTPRASHPADCGWATTVAAGDSGAPAFIYVGGAWKLLGGTFNSAFTHEGTLMSALRWWWWSNMKGRPGFTPVGTQ